MRTTLVLGCCLVLLLAVHQPRGWSEKAVTMAGGQEQEPAASESRDESEPSSSKMRDRMKRWRNVMCPEGEPDRAMRAIDALEDGLGGLPPNVERIRALISRVDPLSHYKAFENVEFIAAAIGTLDYPGSPAIDVLWRHGQIDDERRETAKRYIFCIEAWLDGKDVEAAKAERQDCSELADTIYAALGERDDHKRWLAMCLAKTLKEHAYTPWDFILEYGDEDFVSAVYTTILGREPSPDDLKFRVEELRGGKSREQLYLEVFNSAEHRAGHLRSVADALKRGTVR